MGEHFPRLWTYLGIKGLLTLSEEKDLVLDPNHPIQDRMDAATAEWIETNPDLEDYPAMMDWLRAPALSKLRIQYQ